MKILHLIIKKEYFDQILAGVKKKEYRLIKPFWTNKIVGREYDVILFQNGYNADSPKMIVEYKGYQEEILKHEFFGESEVNVYAIMLGKILETKDLK